MAETSFKQETKLAEAQFTAGPVPGGPSDGPRERAIFWSAVALCQAFGLAGVILMVVWTVEELGGLAWTGAQQFNLHPLLLATGFIYLYANAILVFRMFPNRPKLWLKVTHATLHASAACVTVVGMVAVFDYKKFVKKDDLYSLHSWLGISALGLFGLQYISGFGSFLLPWAPATFRARLLPFHTFFGVGIFLMGVVSALTGTMEKLMWTPGYGSTKFTPAGAMGNCYGMLLAVFAFLVVFLVTRGKYKRQARPEDVHGTSSKYTITEVN